MEAIQLPYAYIKTNPSILSNNNAFFPEVYNLKKVPAFDYSVDTIIRSLQRYSRDYSLTKNSKMCEQTIILIFFDTQYSQIR